MKRSIFTFGEEASLTIHNIRNSLAVVKLNLEKMEEDCQQMCSRDHENWTPQMVKQTYEAFAEHRQRIQRLLVKMGQTIEIIKHQQRDFKQIVKVESVDIKRLLSEVIDGVLDRCKKVIQVKYDLNMDQDPLLHQLRVYQILTNTIQNAAEAIERNQSIDVGSLDISCCYEQKDFVVEVKDNGEGISEEDLSRIGEMGFSRKDKGTGLGVYYCRKIVQDECGGTMLVSSPGQGKGATFKFRFPGACV